MDELKRARMYGKYLASDIAKKYYYSQNFSKDIKMKMLREIDKEMYIIPDEHHVVKIINNKRQCHAALRGHDVDLTFDKLDVLKEFIDAYNEEFVDMINECLGDVFD